MLTAQFVSFRKQPAFNIIKQTLQPSQEIMHPCPVINTGGTPLPSPKKHAPHPWSTLAK